MTGPERIVKKLVLIWCLCTLKLVSPPLAAQVFSDQYFRKNAEKGLEMVYNCQFEAAHKHFSSLDEAYPAHPAPQFLLGLNRWWQSYISTTDVYHEAIFSHLKTARKRNQSFKNRSEFALEYAFFQYMILAFQARLHILRKEYFSAANTGRKALPHLKAGFQYASQSPEFYFSSGIYHYYAETYPRQHPVVRPFMVFFPDGDAELGLTELEQAAASRNFTQTEAMFYLGDIYLDKENQREKALTIKARLTQKYPANLWFKVDYARALILTEEVGSARPILEEIVRDFERQVDYATKRRSSANGAMTNLTMMHAYHWLGRVYQTQKMAQSAADQFVTSLKMAELAQLTGNPLLPANHYYIAEIAEQQQRFPDAIKHYEHALQLPDNESVRKKAKEGLQRLKAE
ncbi:MAG: tetratricopeptide repeat protein [Bacteroidota bacterium]